MKNCFRKTLSLLLTLSLLCALSLPAAASEALGEDLTSKEIILNEETQLSTNVFWSTSYSDLRQENFITYTPNRDVTPIVTFGGVLTGTKLLRQSSLKAMAAPEYARGIWPDTDAPDALSYGLGWDASVRAASRPW